MTLRNWENSGWLLRHKTTPQEIRDLLRIADRDLSDCETKGLSSDWRFNIAYNAALQLSIAALAACGYRTSRQAHHYRSVQSLALTLGILAPWIDALDHFRKKRNMSDYEQADLISDQEVQEMIALAKDLKQKVLSWLRLKHPGLYPS